MPTMSALRMLRAPKCSHGAINITPCAIEAAERPMFRSSVPWVERQRLARPCARRIDLLHGNSNARDRPERRVSLPPFHAGILDRHGAAVALKLHQKVELDLFMRKTRRQPFMQVAVSQRVRQRSRTRRGGTHAVFDGAARPEEIR